MIYFVPCYLPHFGNHPDRLAGTIDRILVCRVTGCVVRQIDVDDPFLSCEDCPTLSETEL